MRKKKKKKKKKKFRPTDPIFKFWSGVGQHNNLFFFGLTDVQIGERGKQRVNALRFDGDLNIDMYH